MEEVVVTQGVVEGLVEEGDVVWRGREAVGNGFQGVGFRDRKNVEVGGGDLSVADVELGPEVGDCGVWVSGKAGGEGGVGEGCR